MRMNRGSIAFWAVLILGLGLRTYHYARGPAVWHDEAAMIANVLRLPLDKLLGPLLYDEASPPLFLLIEKATVAILGDGIYSLRLPSFLAACISLLFVARLARQLLPNWYAALAVGLFAISDRLLWHACEAKAYSFDVGIAAGVALSFWESRNRGLFSRCLFGALISPVLIWSSFPACFVLGAALLALFPEFLKSKWKDRIGYALFTLSVGVSFVLLVLGPAKAQRTGDMEVCWEGAFADWNRPMHVPVWAILNTLEVARYLAMPFGQGLLIPAALGIWSFAKKRGLPIAILLSVPWLLVLIAALLGKYPYSASRVIAFLVPAFALAVVEGLRRCVEWCWPNRYWRWGLLVWPAILIIPVGYTAYYAVRPWPRAATDEASAYVLNHRGATDPIFANHWEYDYYLRGTDPERVCIRHSYNPGPGWLEWALQFGPERAAIWVIHTEGPRPAHYPYTVPLGYRIAEIREFTHVGVLRLEPLPQK